MHKRQNSKGQSLFLLLLSACGGGGGLPPAPDRGGAPMSISGRVFDTSPVSGARVYVDVNNNNHFDEGIDHYIGRTDQTGTYEGTIPLQHRGKSLLADLTTAESSDTPGEFIGGMWRAPEGSKIISPLTDLMVMLDKDSEEILNLLNLDSDIDLTIYDPFSDGEPDPTDQQVIEIDPNLVLELIRNKHQLEEKIADLSDIVSVFDAANVIKIAVPEKYNRYDALHTLAPPPDQPGGTFALTDGYIDNHLFTINPDTGALMVKDFMHRYDGAYNESFDYKNPFDKNFDNTYDLEVAYVAPDKTRHETHLAVTVTDIPSTVKTEEEEDIHFFPFQIPEANLPSGDIKYIIRGLAFDMPWTGPLIITWGLDMRKGHHGLDHPDKVKKATAFIEQAIAEFESAANIKFVKSTATHPFDSMMNFKIYDGLYVGQDNAAGYSVNMFTGLNHERFYGTLVHEMGHKLGLKHNFGEQFLRAEHDWPDIDDSKEWGKKTVMSYEYRFSKKENVLTDLDKAALSYIYGKKGSNFDGIEKHIGKDIRTGQQSEEWHEPIVIDENYDISMPVVTSEHDKTQRLTSDFKDNHLFRIDSITGDVFFKASPDYESPKDSFGGAKFSYNNIYQISIEKFLDNGLAAFGFSEYQRYYHTIVVNDLPDTG